MRLHSDRPLKRSDDSLKLTGPNADHYSRSTLTVFIDRVTLSRPVLMLKYLARQPRSAPVLFARSRFAVSVVALALAVGPMSISVAAQDDKVYNIAELTNPPKLSSSVLAARLIQDSYPEELKRRKVGGLVELQFVVDAQGNVVAGTVEILEATQTALGEAAKKAITRFTFEPGKLNGNKVKSKVVLPIVYKAM